MKQAEGLSEDEVVALRARVTTQFDAGFALPQFPSPDEVAQFPRRLVYAPIGSGVAWWHTAPAGSDASGRPGNVFAHVVLDRSPSEPADGRPIELWRSADWLTPFGPDAVRDAVLPAEVRPDPGPAVSVDAAIDFVLDLTHFRLGTLGALLDGCAEAIRGGRRVVLASEDVESAAMWIGAICYLMPAGFASARFFFSTLERHGTVRAAFDNGVHLACVPMADAELFQLSDDIVVIDEHEPVEIGNLGGEPHRTSRGYEVTATEWSALAQVMLLDTTTPLQSVARLSELTFGLAEQGREPAWGPAMVVCSDPVRYADGVVEAAHVLIRSSPSDLPEERYSEVQSLFESQIRDSTEDSWMFLRDVAPTIPSDSLVLPLLLGLYAVKAVEDHSWLSAPKVCRRRRECNCAARRPPRSPNWRTLRPVGSTTLVPASRMPW